MAHGRLRIETPSLRKVGTGLTPQLKEYPRIINAQIAKAKGMCDACLRC